MRVYLFFIAKQKAANIKLGLNVIGFSKIWISLKKKRFNSIQTVKNLLITFLKINSLKFMRLTIIPVLIIIIKM
jgi:hypothetical protein